ncbi:MAG: bifunctional phosphoribosylaminoimidazolecarboxamide formyltransferase/IMP cyclohydrolase, partial [Tissierellales bacterium]
MKRALISVYDKKGIVEFARELRSLGWEIISTGGTYKELKNAGIEVVDIEEVTGFQEILEGRVKTLNPYIHGGILFKRDDKSHVDTLEKMNIGPIDMVVNNLYPFEETIKDERATHEDIIENIDIGGPSMIRAAAKNYKYVTVVVDPEDYQRVLDELKDYGDTTMETRLYLARKVFNYTAYYDCLISTYFNKLNKVDFPEYLTLGYRIKGQLR